MPIVRTAVDNVDLCDMGRAPCASQSPTRLYVLAGQEHGRAIPLPVIDHGYSITSSARCCRNKGTSMPIAFAVFRLITSSNFVGCSTGRSAGFVPCNILDTNTAPRL